MKMGVLGSGSVGQAISGRLAGGCSNYPCCPNTERYETWMNI
jgi:hypothetical protein